MLHEVSSLQKRVEAENACILPGCSIKPEVLIPLIRRAMSRGYVRDIYGEHVISGLLTGFTLGIDRAQFQRAGKRVFRNYPSAYQAKGSLSEAIDSRVARGKSLRIGKWWAAKDELDSTFKSYFVFPMGAVPKPHQPDVMRPTSDHTRTGLNSLWNTFLADLLKHALQTYKAVSRELLHYIFMYVTDVDDAFPVLPLAPWLWPAMFFRWYRDAATCRQAGTNDDTLFVHLFADFGTAGAPGEFKIFLVDVVLQVGRSELIVSLPVVVHVDDIAMFGPDRDATDAEMLRFQEWCGEESGSGLKFKALKDKSAAIPQVYCGFWWDSRYFTRYLEQDKLLRYLDDFSSAGSSRSLTLRERRSLGGKAQRAILTFPPGAACLVVNCFRLMCGLQFGWQSRRTSKEEKADFNLIHDLLSLNMGRGYYSYSGFSTACDHRSDACKQSSFAGGGWCAADGDHDWFVYGSRAARHLIDELEGDTMVRCIETRSADGSLYMCQVPFGLDNSSFQKSEAKSRSRAPRLNELLRHLFALQVQREFVIQSYWLSSGDNYLSDDLSRGRIGHFYARLAGSGFLSVPVTAVQARPDAGRIVRFDRPGSTQVLRQCLKNYSSNEMKNAVALSTLRVRGGMPTRGKGVEGDAQVLSISYSPTSIYWGLPPDLEARLDEVMDNRLAVSSRDKVMSGVKRWTVHCGEHGWNPILDDEDRQRGGKLCSWVLSLCDDTSLAFSSICVYLWGVRTWHVMQHMQDPIFGCRFWREFIRGIAVLTAVVGEPRKQVPLETVQDILKSLDQSNFRDVNFGLMLVTLLYTFSRTECPCPKTWTGNSCFDAAQHWTEGDFKLLRSPTGRGYVLWVRFKAIKQDARIERPSAHTAVAWLPFDPEHDGLGRDWVPIGDVDDPLFSISRWYIAHRRLVGRARDKDEPMFLAMDKSRAYTYSCLMADFKFYVARVDGDVSLGPHGIRVLGYNLSRRSVGADLTQAHGGWMSSGHSRYERFAQEAVLGIPAAMLGLVSSFEASGEPRSVHRGRTSRGASAVEELSEPESGDDEPASAAQLDSAGDGASGSASGSAAIGDIRDPPGFAREDRVTQNSRYSIWVGPSGDRFRSRRAAWAAYAGVAAEQQVQTVVETVDGHVQTSAARARRSMSPSRTPRARQPPPVELAAGEARNLFPPPQEDNWGLARPDVNLARLRPRGGD